VAISTYLRSSLCVLAVFVTATAQPAAQHARAELLARQASVNPGSDLQLGVHFILEKGWHIYWINPGDSGQPPSFEWQLPPGFTAGEIQWPRPERMQSSAELADYGYHDDALLMVPIHAPQVINNEQLRGLRFAVEARWLVCREICIPEHAGLELFLHSGTIRENSATAKLFAEAEKLLPVPMPQGWKAEAESRKDNFLLTRPVQVLRGVLAIAGGPAYRIEAPVRHPIQ